MDMRKLHQFAEEYHQLFGDSSIRERDVIDGFAEKCFELNLEMDCGHAFQETYGVRAFNSPQSLEKIIDVVDDPIILGSGIFSQWRYVTHWSMGSLLDKEFRDWFVIAFKRLCEITEEKKGDEIMANNEIPEEYFVIQPETRSTEPMVVGFYRETGVHGCFCNWYPAEFDYAGINYKNTEQFMMYQKVCQFGYINLGEHIMREENPQVCKNLAGKKNAPADDAQLKRWHRTRHAIVKRGVKAKFAQNPEMLKELLDTGTALLAECSPIDGIWGIQIGLDDPNHQDVSKWQGDNHLGVILMEVREELRQELRESSNGTIEYIDYRYAAPIDEWMRTAGELKRIPQYYSAIHAYADALPNHHVKDLFYNSASLYEWEIAMNTNMGGGLPWAGFFEMKQEVYEIAKRLKAYSEYEIKL